MRLQGSLACLLLALCLGGGEAGPLLRGGEEVGAEVGQAMGHGMGDAIGQGLGDAISHGVEEAVGQGTGGAAGSASRQAMSLGMEEAAQGLGNPGHEAGRQAENTIRLGGDAAHSSGQAMPGGSGVWGTNGQPPSGGHGIFGAQGGSGGHSQGNPGGLGTPWGQGYPGGSDGSFGTHPQGGAWGQGANGGSPSWGPNAQGTVVQPGYGSVRGSSKSHAECTNPPPSGSGGSSSGNSGGYNTGSSSGSGGGSGSSGGNKPECNTPGNEARMSGGSGGQGFGGGQGGPGGSGDVREISKEGSHVVVGSQGNYQWQGPSGGGEAVSGINTLDSQTSPGLFNFDTFWKNFKSKLGFINWDAINKGQVPPPSTRALLYFSRLWEDFKHNTPFLNWKAIIEGADPSSLQKRSGGAGQSGTGWQEAAAVTSKHNYNQQAYPTPSGGQYSAKIPSKGGATPSSSASRVQPGLLQWVKFW
ncbi:dermokine isoform X2 [Crocuta crocuta]